MNMYFDLLYWSRISRDDFDGDIMAVTKVAEPPKTVPRSYLTTHNPYMSRDWTR